MQNRSVYGSARAVNATACVNKTNHSGVGNEGGNNRGGGGGGAKVVVVNQKSGGERCSAVTVRWVLKVWCCCAGAKCVTGSRCAVKGLARRM